MSKRKKKRWTGTALKKAKKSKGNTGPPMCKLCGSAHWNRDPHKYTKKAAGGIIKDTCKVIE